MGALPIEIPTLLGERVALVPLSAAAGDVYRAFYTDRDASQHYGGPLTEGQAWARLASDVGAWHLQGFGVWAIEDSTTHELIGVCGFWQGGGWPRELTWWLVPAARGKGFAAEASRLAVAHAYHVFGWDSVETYVEDHNTAARQLALRLAGLSLGRRQFPDGIERELFRIPPID